MAEQLNPGDAQYKFAVGERVLVVATIFDGPTAPVSVYGYAGTTAQITKHILPTPARDELPLTYLYQVRTHDGREWMASNHSLRPLPPQREDLQLTTWDRCIWKPEGVRA